MIAAGDWDHDISDWAREETPLFGSQQRASDQSGTFRSISYAGMLASAAAIHDEEDYWMPLTKRLTVEHAGEFAAPLATDLMKDPIGRTRPDGEPGSFPSTHSSKAFASAALTYRNIDALGLDPEWEYGTKSLATLSATATAWARVEAGKHYPTDVLAGAAIGNFVALLLHDAFLGKDFPIGLQAGEDGHPLLTLQWGF